MAKGKYIRTKENNKKLSEIRKKLFLEGKIKSWNKGKKMLEETKKKMIQTKRKLYSEGKIVSWSKGKHINEESKKKMSETKKRLFKEGIIKPWNKGLTKDNNEILRKVSEHLMGTMPSKQTIEGSKRANTGKHPSEETRKKLSISKIGNKNRLGIPHTEEIKKQISKSGKGKHHDWKGKKMPPFTEEHKKHMSESAMGKKFSKESIEKSRLTRIKLGCVAGEKNPAWLGGISFLPYGKDFNKKFKLEILKRDQFCCIKCGKTSIQNLMDFNKNLAIHHTDYNKENNDISNLCSLCLRCHMETNFNRPQWTQFFQSLLSQKYGYQYQENTPISFQLTKM